MEFSREGEDGCCGGMEDGLEGEAADEFDAQCGGDAMMKGKAV